MRASLLDQRECATPGCSEHAPGYDDHRDSHKSDHVMSCSCEPDDYGHLPHCDAVGWTAEEFFAAPEMATRLHRRILDLEDSNERLRAALELIAAPKPTHSRDWRRV